MSQKEELTREVCEQILAAVPEARFEQIEGVAKTIADELALGEAFREAHSDLSEQYDALNAKCNKLEPEARLWRNAFGE